MHTNINKLVARKHLIEWLGFRRKYFDLLCRLRLMLDSTNRMSDSVLSNKCTALANCLLRRRYLAFNFIDSDSLRSACQISKSRQEIRGLGQTSTIKISYKVQVVGPNICLFNNKNSFC